MKRQISTWLEAELVARLDAIAEASGASRSLLVEQAIKHWLARQTAKRRTKK